ncbi:MAG: nicotinamide riboside transporter PnuC [Acholeplasmatales bacterium]|jgi:nicotinamide mononucleotide transporter PnuC|nr:nicotinamide riboside transporter PnuC [Acholeplasmatales bacterium]
MKYKKYLFEIITIISSAVIIIASEIIFSVLGLTEKGKIYLPILAILSSIFGIVYISLCVKNNKYALLFGVLNNLFYGVISIFNQTYLIAAYALLYCIPIMIIGLVKRKNNKTDLKHMTKKLVFLAITIFIIAAVAFTGVLFLLNKYVLDASHQSNYIFLDGPTIALLLVSLFLLTNQYIECYIFFGIANIAGCVMNVLLTVNVSITNLPLVVMWIIYLVCGIMGYFSWTKLYNTLHNEVTLEEKRK